MDAGALSEIIKTKVASLIHEQLKPIISELAAQHRMLQTHSALLKYNHNVNDYQMSKLENLRDLEQSINFKVAGALAFDPWQHPTTGTNLREPVPADPRLIPHFTPESQTPAERAASSAELIAQAGVSARRLGVPLTLHDFPRDPKIHSGGENEDPMHAAVPLFGLRAPRWRAIEGLPLDTAPGLATYNGVPAPPTGKKGKRLYAKRSQAQKAQKMKPKWKSFDAATAPRGPSRSGSSSSSSTIGMLFDLLNDPALAGPSGTSGETSTTTASGVTLSPESPATATPTPTPSTSISTIIAPVPSHEAPPPAPIPIPAPAPVPTPTPIPTASSISLSCENPSTTPPSPPSLKRTRRTAELEDDNGSSSNSSTVTAVVPPLRTSPEEPRIKRETEEPEPEPLRKRRRRSAAPSPSLSFSLAVNNTPDAAGTGDGWPGPRQLRRSARVARAHPYATNTTAAPAPRKRKSAGNGKRTTRRS